MLKKLQDNQLCRDYEAAVSTLERILLEVVDWYTRGNQTKKERSKYYDEPKENAAFDRCVDVIARLIQRHGSQVLEHQQEENCEKEMQPQHFEKAA